MAGRVLGPQYVVYGLSTDGVDHRYVGFTAKNGLKNRMASHRFRARHEDSDHPFLTWMREVGPENVVTTVLEKLPFEASLEDLWAAETRWIARLRLEGYDLLNKSCGGPSASGIPGPRWPRKPEDPTNASGRTGKKHKPHHFDDINTQVVSGGRAAHNRWHVARGLTKESCMFCSERSDP